MAARANEDICNMALVYAGANQKIQALSQLNSAAAQALNSIFVERRRALLGEFRWPFAIVRKQLVPIAGNPFDGTAYALNALVSYGSNVYRSLQAANTNNQPNLAASAAWWQQVTRDGYAYVCPLPGDCLDPIGVWQNLGVSANNLTPLWVFGKPDLQFPNLRNPRSDERAPFVLENSDDGYDNQVLLTDLDTPVLKYVKDMVSPSGFTSKFAEAFAWDLSGPLAMALRGDEKKAQSCAMMAKIKLDEAIGSVMRDMQADAEPVSEFEASREGLS